MTKLITEPYLSQTIRWPKSGHHILAQFDVESVVVYQAYRSSIGKFAKEHGYFGGEFSYSRMSWIKPNFLWMMYRSGWGTKAGQEVTLAIRIHRSFFDSLLAQAVESSFTGFQYATYEEWKKAVVSSSVRMQWDPDHHPRGTSLPRRALQLGLRSRALKDYGKNEILEILDISSFVIEQRENNSAERISELITPMERVYLPDDPKIRTRLGLDYSDTTSLSVSS
jgi:hypothetical protein